MVLEMKDKLEEMYRKIGICHRKDDGKRVKRDLWIVMVK